MKNVAGRTSKHREERKKRHQRYADAVSEKERRQLQQRAKSMRLSEQGYGGGPAAQHNENSVADAISHGTSSVHGLSDINV